MPVVRGFPAPLSCTTTEPGTGRAAKWPTTAEMVVPQAMPSTMFGPIHPETRRPATRATCSSRCTSELAEFTETTWQRTPNVSCSSARSREPFSPCGATVICTRPVARAWWMRRETVDRETSKRRAIVSIVSSCR